MPSWVLDISKDRDSTSLSITFQFLVILTLKMFFLSVCQIVPIGSCPFSGYNWEEPGSLFIAIPTLPCQVFVHMDKIPPESSLLWFPLSHPLSHNLFLYVKCSSPLNTFVTPHWTCFRTYKTLLSWESQHWTQHSQFVVTVLSRLEGSCIHPLKLCLKTWKALLRAQWMPHQSFELPGGLCNFCVYVALHPVLFSEQKKDSSVRMPCLCMLFTPDLD